MLAIFKDTVKNLWFRDSKEESLHINDTAVRIRAGIMLVIPVFMIFTLIDIVYGPTWEIVENTTQVDTFETDWEDRIVYQVEAVKRVYDYTFQTQLLVYALIEMLLGLSVIGSRLSPTILLASFLTIGRPTVWKPIAPKRCAWIVGAVFITICLIFFNPDSVALWINNLIGTSIPVDENYVPSWLALNLVWMCLLFMWIETVIGLCVGCKIYSLLVKIGLFERYCEACENIDWDKIKRNKQARLDKKQAKK